MATTEEIVAKYRLDLDELKTQVSQLQSEFKKVDDGAKKTSSAVDQSFKALGDQLKKLGAAVVAAFAADKIIGFAKSSVQAFAEAEAGALKLRNAVGARGGLPADFEKLTKQAEELAGITIFDDDQIKAAQTLALQFGLNSNAVEKLLPKVADFAAATGQDLTSALQGVLGGINGQERALKAYGISLDGATTRNERLATITQQLTDKFNGQAQALTNTVGGAIGQAEKAYGELKEAVGESLGPLATNLAQSLTSIFNALQDPPIDGLRKEQEALQATALEIYGLEEGTTARSSAIKKLQEQYPAYLGNLNAEKVGNDELRAAINKVNDELTFKIAQQQLETDLQPLREKAAAAALEEADARRELAIQLNKIYDRTLSYNNAKNEQAVKDLQSLDIAQQAYLLQNGAIELYGISRASLGEVSTAYDNVNAAALRYATSQVELNDKLGEARDQVTQLRETLGIPQESTVNVTVKTTGLEGLTEEEQAAADKRAQEYQKQLSDQQKARLQAALEEAKLIEGLRQTELKTSQEALDIYQAQQLAAIQQRYAAQNVAAQQQAQVEQAALLQQLQQGLITREDYEKQKQEIINKIPNTEAAQAIETAELERQVLAAKLQNILDYTVARQDILTKSAELEQKIAAAKAAGDPALVAQLEQEKAVLDQRLQLVVDNVNDKGKAEQALAEKTAQVQQLQTDAELKATDARLKNAEDETLKKQEQLDKQEADRKAFNERALELAGDLGGQLFDLTLQLDQQRIEQLEAEKEQRTQDYEDQQTELDDQYEKRLIGAAQYEAASQQIAQQKVKTEQDISDKVKAIRRREDVAKKAQALFNIYIDTASAIQAQLKTTPLPAGAPLVALIAASGIAQAGIVLSQKPPQYAEGTSYVPLGKNKPGRDTIPALLDEGERVISRRKNLKHWDLYEAVDGERLPQYIFRTYTAPVLQRERERSQLVFHELTQALHRQSDTLTVAVPSVTTTTADSSELRRLWRRGLPISNLDELADLLADRSPSPYRA